MKTYRCIRGNPNCSALGVSAAWSWPMQGYTGWLWWTSALQSSSCSPSVHCCYWRAVLHFQAIKKNWVGKRKQEQSVQTQALHFMGVLPWLHLKPCCLPVVHFLVCLLYILVWACAVTHRKLIWSSSAWNTQQSEFINSVYYQHLCKLCFTFDCVSVFVS